MASYNLQPNESIIMKSDRVLHGGVLSGYTNELILTNLNIILIFKGVFGNEKGIKKISISQIKKFNEKPQVFQGRRSNGYPQLEIYLIDGQEIFGFESKKAVNSWVKNITNLVTGISSDYEIPDNKFIPGMDLVSESFQETFDSIKTAVGFNIKEKKSENREIIATQCEYCGAPLSGFKSDIVFCEYCDSRNQF